MIVKIKELVSTTITLSEYSSTPSSLDAPLVWVSSGCHVEMVTGVDQSVFGSDLWEGSRVPSVPCPRGTSGWPAGRHHPPPPPRRRLHSLTPRERIMRTGRGCTAHLRAAYMFEPRHWPVSSPYTCHTTSPGHMSRRLPGIPPTQTRLSDWHFTGATKAWSD